MENPWLELRPDGNTYVLKRDLECLERHNQHASEETKFAMGSIPEPFIGNPKTAKVVFLGKNPGHAPNAEKEYQSNHELRKAMFSNLRHELMDYPFYPLNPKFANTGAGKWWLLRTRELQEELHGDFQKLAERMMVIEWFPYHSICFSGHKCKCPSQDYSAQLVKQMLDKKVLVVGMRARCLWIKKDLGTEKIQFLRNPRCGHISKGNTDGQLFQQIIAALK